MWITRYLFALVVLVQCLLQGIPVARAASDDAQRTLVVATSKTWPPYSYVDQNGELRGMIIDFWREYGRRNQIQIIFRPSAWAQTLQDVKTGQADVHSGLFFSDERDVYLDFSRRIPIELASRLFVSRHLTVEGVDELGAVPVGVTRDGYAQYYLEQQHPDVKMKFYDSSATLIKAAVEGEIVAFASDYPAAMYFLSKLSSPEEFHVVQTLYTRSLRSAVAQAKSELLLDLDHGLSKFPQSEVDRISQKWIQATYVTPRWVLPTVVSLFVGLVFVGGFVYTVVLRRQVRTRTEELRQLSSIDPLTGIKNRRSIEEVLQTELYRARRYGEVVSLILTDIDFFKHINDTHGHAVGDAVLVRFAECVQANLRQSDGFGRWGGEEFLIVCPETDHAHACRLAEKLRTVIQAENFPEAGERTASFGVVEARPGECVREIFMRADQSLYKAKSMGRNRVVCDSECCTCC